MKQMYKWMFCLAAAIPVAAADWPQWGQTNSRNMVTTEKNLPTDFTPGKPLADGSAIDPATSKNIKWTARLGDQTYGNPTISGGKIFIGTNNAHPRNQNRAGDYAVLMCFDQATGKFIWQLTSPKLAAGKAVDWENIGLCSSPTVDGDRVYIVTNRCEVICVTTNGLAKENVGPFVDEAKFIKNDPPTNTGEAPPDETNLKLDPATDADIVWRYDMRDELGIFPHNMTASSILVVGDKIFVTTSNGVDWSNKHAPAPKSPALVCLDKKTGKYIGEEKSGISARTFKSNWSSPASGKIKTDAGEKEIIIFGGGDGYCYGFDPAPVDGTLKELWRCEGLGPSNYPDTAVAADVLIGVSGFQKSMMADSDWTSCCRVGVCRS